MKVTTAKKWYWWHKWTSLVCTLFLLMLAVTGLPLIFHAELDELLDPPAAVTAPNKDALPISTDSLIKIAEMNHPGTRARYVFWDQDQPNTITIDVADAPDAPVSHSNYEILNSFTGDKVGKVSIDGFTYKLLQIHTDMFAGIPGKLFLGFMGLLFLISVISGVVLYGKVMKRYDFGMIRKANSRKIRWLDTHNLLGIVMTVWLVVVGVTGIINTLSDSILGKWKATQLQEMTRPYLNQPPLTGAYSSLDSAVVLAQRVSPNMGVFIVTFPGTIYSTKHHYAIFMHGNTALTSKLLKPVLIDAKTGELTDSRTLPWYMNALFLSEPLHFGDYGGMTLKIIWAIFDLLTIIVLVTGVYLWWKRRKPAKKFWKGLESENGKNEIS